MQLSPHEQERLLVVVAADVAQRRRDRGLRLNHPEAVAVLTAWVFEGARDGSTVVDLMVQNDTFRGVVTGIIRGARTVRINPTGSDTYEIVLEIDRDVIARLIQAADRYT